MIGHTNIPSEGDDLIKACRKAFLGKKTQASSPSAGRCVSHPTQPRLLTPLKLGLRWPRTLKAFF